MENDVFGFSKGDKVEVIKEDPQRAGDKDCDYCSKGKRGTFTGKNNGHWLLIEFEFKNPKNGKTTKNEVGCLYTDIKKL